MNRSEAKSLLPIFKAFCEGKAIQYRHNDGVDWFEVGDIWMFNLDKYTYRIKPEPKYRPFENAEECWNEMLKHQPFGWVKDKEDGDYVSITVIEKESVSINGNNGWEFKEVLSCYTFADATPFGLKVEEE